MSSSNTLLHEGKEYAIDDIKTKLQVFTEKAPTQSHSTPSPTPTPTPSPISEIKHEKGRVSINIKNINAPGTNQNKKKMVLLVEDAANAAINNEKINMRLSDHKLEKIETDDELYNYNFAVAVDSNMLCVGSCDIVEEVIEFIMIKFEKNFDAAMKKAADDYQVKDLFRNAQVDINSFAYSSTLFSNSTPSPSSSPKRALQEKTLYPTLRWDPNADDCRNRNTMQSLIKRFLSM